MDSFEEAIRHHLRLGGQSDVSDEQLRDLLGESSPGVERVPRTSARSSRRDTRPPKGPKPLLAKALGNARITQSLVRRTGELARTAKPVLDAVRPVLPRVALASASLVIVIILVPAAVAAARSDRVADGLKVGGVPVAGLSAEAAHRMIEHRFALAQRQPLVLRFGRRTFPLSPSKSRVSTDVSRAVAMALEHSRRAPLLKRFLHALRGGPSVDLRAPVSFSERATRSFMRRVSREIDRPARNAKVRPLGRRLAKVPDRPGAAVDRLALESLLRSRLVSADGSRELAVPTRPVRARMTVADLPRRYGRYVVIRRSEFRLEYFHHLRRVGSYPIAVGTQGLETPAGDYEIQGKQINPVWQVPESPWAGSKAGKLISPEPKNPIKARWLGFDGSAGIHGTTELDSLGQAASHGVFACPYRT